MTSTSLLQLVDNLQQAQQAGKIRNLQQVCGVSGCVVKVKLVVIVIRKIVYLWKLAFLDESRSRKRGSKAEVAYKCMLPGKCIKSCPSEIFIVFLVRVSRRALQN